MMVMGMMSPRCGSLGMRLMSLDSDQDAALRMSEHYPTLGMQVFRVEKPWAELDGRDESDLHGLVLLDLPDHDSTRVSHRIEVDRLVRLVDLLVQVGVQGLVVAATGNGSVHQDLMAALLRAQAAQRRQERFVRAERLALQAPVKLLMPLATCVFPGTFAILFFPVVVRLMQQGPF